MNDKNREDVAFAARTISYLAAMSDAMVSTADRGTIHVSQALDDRIFVGDLIRFGLKAVSGGGSWSDSNDGIGRHGVPVSVIGLAFDYALDAAPVDGAGAISAQGLAATLSRVEKVSGAITGYPSVADACAEMASAPALSGPSNDGAGA